MKSDLKRLKETFEKMELDEFDTMNYLKWGFYFFDREKESLLKLLDDLKRQGFTFENLKFMDDNQWRLFVSIIDVLTPEKLHKQNNSFNDIAKSYNVSLYDGWDVEKTGNVSL